MSDLNVLKKQIKKFVDSDLSEDNMMALTKEDYLTILPILEAQNTEYCNLVNNNSVWESRRGFKELQDLPAIPLEDVVSKKFIVNLLVKCTNSKSFEELKEYVRLHDLWDLWSGGILQAIETVQKAPSIFKETEKS